MANDFLGKTDVEKDNLRNMLSFEDAVLFLEKKGVESPEEAIDSFVDDVPNLLQWLEKEGRAYEWRRTRDTWSVYTAEILLQRTRADAVSEVFPVFISEFPEPESLHKAEDEEVREIVESLGFVNHRVRALKDISRIIVEEHDGEIPNSTDKLKEGWRVGEYVARAVQLFARGKSMALVDANIVRVIGRVLNYDMPSQPHKSDEVYELMTYLTPNDPDVARAYYFALIDLGALICTPSNPKHEKCPLRNCCRYYRNKKDK